MPYPVFTAGQRLTAALLSAMQVNLVRKLSDQTVSNSTTLVNATDLSIPVAANATYLVRLRASYSASTTGDVKFSWTSPSGATVQRYIIGPTSGTTDTSATTVQMRRRSGTASPAGGDGTANFSTYQEDISVQTTGTAGTLQLQFAQNTVDAANGTILRADSYIEYLRIA
ncbi:hypothetical protein GCM10023196_035480 [Actinoallomurus vinaceus]|uniref:Uncharacterized protein n=1 Tax=Actinoallomurus vinaceus TaxID=1080074 RepID=A0ABP8U902_9ACTN